MALSNYIHRAIQSYAFSAPATGRSITLLSGPREAGKTCLLKAWLQGNQSEDLYFDLSQAAVRRRLERAGLASPEMGVSPHPRWVVFEGLDKRSDGGWFLARYRELYGDLFRFVVTANHDEGFDGLVDSPTVGGIVRFEVMPLNFHEILALPPAQFALFSSEIIFDKKSIDEFISSITLDSAVQAAARCLFDFGPFPEPFLRQSERFSIKWHQSYFDRVLQQEVRGRLQISGVERLEHLLVEVGERIGQPFSMAAAGRAVQIAHPTVKAWLEVLERFYLIFPVSPWHRNVSRGLKKAVKWYFMDWCFAPRKTRLENLVASTLHTWCVGLNARCLGNYRLHYLRTLDKRGLQFIVVKGGRPIVAVEAAPDSEGMPRSTIRSRRGWFADRGVPALVVVDRAGDGKRISDHTWVLGIDRFLHLFGS